MSSDWSKYLAKGIQVAPGESVSIRKDVRDMSPAELYLYFEGLKKFQNEPTSEPLSYYQIAGLHGLPYGKTWPNASLAQSIPMIPNAQRGFCTHSSILFLTWHRPYLSLFETALYQHVNDFAAGIDDSDPTKAQYVTIAKNFRMPYWDWARKGQTSIFPTIAAVNVNDITGPLSKNAYKGPNYNPLFFAPFQADAPDLITNGPARKARLSNGTRVTYRYPGESRPTQALQRALMEFYQNPDSPDNTRLSAKNLTERVAYILLSYQRYQWMSNNEYQDGNSGSVTANAEKWGSLEDIHNSIHTNVGGYQAGTGFMSQVPWSAFDPIFWLHHTLLAMWQVLWQDPKNPDSWVTDHPSPGDLITPSGKPQNAATKLYPFRPDTASWYDSDDVKDTKVFGYAYAEQGKTRDQLIQQILTDYAPAHTLIQQSIKGQSTAGDFLLPQAEILKQISTNQLTANSSQMLTLAQKLPEPQALLDKSNEPSKPLIKDVASDNKYLEWLVNIKAAKHTLNGVYSVHVFLGAVDETEVDLWPVSPHHVGAFAPLGQETNTGCGKCQEDQARNLEVTSQIPLTIALIQRYLAGILPDMNPATVIAYLTENLHWKVEVGGNVLEDRSDVAGLTVFVVSNEVTLPEDPTQLPIYADDVTIYPQITTKADGTSGRGEGTGLTVDAQ